MVMLVGKQAPDFCVSAVLADGTIVPHYRLSEAIKGKYGVVFFYPLDFTFVCPSELIALDKRVEDFKQRGVELVAVSIDSQFTHKAWRDTPHNAGGIGHIGYTLAADVGHEICQSYGVEHPVAKVAFRGTFIIDREGVVRSQMVNDLPLGRSIDEILRLIDALQFHEKHGEVCPANWQAGKKGMKASPEGVASYLSNAIDDL